MSLALAEREVKFVRTQTIWDHHATILIHEKQFHVKYRMPYASFDKLCSMLTPSLLMSDAKSMNSCGNPSIAPPIILALTIRWLSGGSYHDIRDTGNISRASFYRLLWMGLNALNSSEALQIKLPSTQAELKSVYNGFASKSTESIMEGCVGALDGFLLLIDAPKATEAANIRSFFSGH